MDYLGRAVQVDPIKFTLKPPGLNRLKLKHGKPLSSLIICFQIQLAPLHLGVTVALSKNALGFACDIDILILGWPIVFQITFYLVWRCRLTL